MKFKVLPLGVYQANCYIVTDEKDNETAVIDPGGDFDQLKRYIEHNNLKVRYIILTHGHGDHIGALAELKEYTKAPVCINENDSSMLKDSRRNLSRLIGGKGVEIETDLKLKDGDVLELGDTKLEIIHTPGHTKGGICIRCGNVLFSGDTLFACSIGRTDLEGGSYEEILSSIKNKLFILPEDTEVYPGHGAATTIKTEKKHNPFFN